MRRLVGLPILAGDLGVGMYRAFGGGLQRVGGQAGLGREPAGAGGLGLEAVHAVAVLVAIVVGELAGEVPGLRDLGAVERCRAVGGTDEGADDRRSTSRCWICRCTSKRSGMRSRNCR